MMILFRSVMSSLFLLLLSQATKTKKPTVVSVVLMDGRAVSLPVDSASTSKEIGHLLANKIQLTDDFGFSLYVTLYEKVRPCHSEGHLN